ncbi:hypothetical protein DdX_01764 [Ditylenchus destructor]|uniref:ARC105/Med15 mediator subunit C-terminal domain-containing protein n=1 Tax=Ditylenchus destructor TaxID=166010 RepID=A0AAD4NHD5_9BILA|nr:hypothetical protein DdX_01764 [Ditylenchus destructor]
MNYGDQQQHFIAQQQRLAQQQGQPQRMQMPMPQQGMPMQRQPPQNIHMGGQYPVGMQPGPTQQQTMQHQRILMQQQGQPMSMYQQQPQGMQHHDQSDQAFQQHHGYQQPTTREALVNQQRMSNLTVAFQQLPEEDRLQIQREQDPERRKMMFQALMNRRQQSMMNGASSANPSQMQMAMQQRMAAAHQNAQQQHHQGSPMMYGQQQPGGIGGNQVQGGPGMQTNIGGPPMHMQRIPSQSAFGSGPDQQNSQQQQQPGLMSNIQTMGAQTQPSAQTNMQGNQQMSTPQSQTHQTHSLHQPASNQSSIGHPASQPQQQPMSVGPHSHHSQQGSSPMPSQQQGGPQSLQQASTGPLSVQQPRSHQQSLPAPGYMGSPAVQPGQVASTGPHSVGGPGSVRPNTPGSRPVPSVPPTSVPPPSIDQNAPEYKEALERLKNYHEPVKRLYFRLKIDDPTGSVNKTLVTSLERVIEIMEGQRVVDMHLIEKLINNVRKALAAHNPSRYLYDTLKKISNMQQASESTHTAVTPMHNILPDPWHDVRHLQIKVPDHVRRLVESQGEGNPAKENIIKNDRKRKSEHDAKDIPPEKKERNLLATLAASFSTDPSITHTSAKNDNSLEPSSQNIQPVRVECFNGNWIRLNSKTSQELNQLPMSYKFDSDFKPISESCSHVQLLVASSKTKAVNGSAPILRLLLPVDYPESPVQLYNGQGSNCFEENALLEQFKLRLDLGINLHSLMDVANAWAEFVEESHGKQKSKHLNGFGLTKEGQTFQSIVSH